MKFSVLFLFALSGVALVNWIAAALEKRELYIASKPLVLIVLIAFFAKAGGLDAIRLPFLIALIFSLIGDIFLIPRSIRWFIAGMTAFLVAHLVYIWAFSRWEVDRRAIAPAILTALAVIAIMIYVVLSRTRNKPEFKHMRFAFILYSSVLVVMTVTALLSLWREGWPVASGAMAGLGGLFFFASDTILGLEKMGKRLPATRLLVISTYHIAQTLIVFSTLRL